MFLFDKLFSQRIPDLPTGHMELPGVTSVQHSSRRIIQTLSHGSYSDSDSWKFAIQSAALIISHGRLVQKELSFTASGLTQP